MRGADTRPIRHMTTRSTGLCHWDSRRRLIYHRSPIVATCDACIRYRRQWHANDVDEDRHVGCAGGYVAPQDTNRIREVLALEYGIPQHDHELPESFAFQRRDIGIWRIGQKAVLACI